MIDEKRIVTHSPENSETPLESLRSWVTPARLFFVRNHFNLPEIDVSRWRLRLDGCVRRPLSLTWDDLADMPQRSVLATIECAGNGRSFLTPHAHGVQWGAGAIAHAEWSGVPLRLVLEEAGLKPATREILFEGADRGTEADHPEPMCFARSLPLDKALHPDTLLALHMNGEPLAPSHGYPLRLLTPGWYGVASVKWLTHIQAIDRAFCGYFQTTKYTIRAGADGQAAAPVRRMAVKSEIVRPRAGEALPPGVQRIFGVAWAGEDAVVRVEISTDGGQMWRDADLLGPQAPYSWTLWEYSWEVETPGCYVILARATSESGEAQPRAHDPLRGGYMINFARPLAVEVQAAPACGRVSPRLEEERVSEKLAHLGSFDADALLYDMNAFAEDNARLPLDVHLEFSHGAGI